MKYLAIALLVFMGSFNLAAQTQDSNSKGTTITVHVPVPGHGGSLIAGLYDEATFMKAEPVQGVDTAVLEGFSTVVFTDVAPGTYGIVLFHDKNGNKNMDFEPNGMPKEMFGVSNNNMAMGPPTWEDAKFVVGTEPIKMEIRL